jgi:hypothetical protein
MRERAKLQREMYRASLISTSLFILGTIAVLRAPRGYETHGIVVSVACIVAGTWWTMKLQRIKKQLQTTP